MLKHPFSNHSFSPKKSRWISKKVEFKTEVITQNKSRNHSKMAFLIYPRCADHCSKPREVAPNHRITLTPPVVFVSNQPKDQDAEGQRFTIPNAKEQGLMVNAIPEGNLESGGVIFPWEKNPAKIQHIDPWTWWFFEKVATLCYIEQMVILGIHYPRETSRM